MNCKVEPMNENRRNHVDTLPPRGRVNEVRREWLVHEDGALAYRLQNEEIKQHLTGNKSRNVQIRQDFPRAKDEQQREAEEAARLHQQLLLQQEQQDAKIAAQLADYIEKEEEERKKMLEEEDKELARLLQEKEKLKVSRKERDFRELETHTPRKDKYFYSDEKRNSMLDGCLYKKDGMLNQLSNSEYLENQGPSSRSPIYYSNLDDINNVGLPIQDELVQPLRKCNLSNYLSYRSVNDVSPPPMSEDEARRIQEEKDEEYARYLQERENLENIDTVNRDRLLAIETQDKELARLLQEKERAKARRAREKAKQRAAMKRMQQEESGSEILSPEEHVTIKTAETVQVNCHRKSQDDLSHRKESPPVPQPDLLIRPIKSKPRYPDPEEIVELPLNGSSTPLPNIAMTIDPTFSKESLEKNGRHKHKSGSKSTKNLEDAQSTLAGVPGPELSEDVNAPPYMPIQGQRRLPEKKIKQKDGCKQQ